MRFEDRTKGSHRRCTRNRFNQIATELKRKKAGWLLKPARKCSGGHRGGRGHCACATGRRDVPAKLTEQCSKIADIDILRYFAVLKGQEVSHRHVLEGFTGCRCACK